jgi:hypothetical protein
MSRCLALPAFAAGWALLAAGCSPSPESEDEPRLRAAAGVEAPAGVSGPSAARDYLDLEPWSGKEVTLEGVFEHDRATHGIVRLASGLRVYIPQFDLFARGSAWLRYVGNRCTATGILHTYTKNIDGFRAPTLEIREFAGSVSE